MYSYDFGILNQVFGARRARAGRLAVRHLVGAWSVVIVDVWHWTPLVFLILFAGVEGLPREVIEAARVDGATTGSSCARIVLPLIAPAIAVAFIFRSIPAFKVFDQIVLLTCGGPGTATRW